MRGYWYGNVVNPKIRRAIIQRHPWPQGKHATLPEAIIRAAAAEYNRQGFGQSYERLQERGGLSDTEIIGLLADALGIKDIDQ